jgi:hypothetical protein
MKTVVALLAAVGLAVYWFGFRPACGKSDAVACPEPALEEGVGVELSAREVCPGAGYLCTGRKPPWQVIRWPLDKGKLRIRVEKPDFVSGRDAEQIREAAIEGILQWDRQPFPIVIQKGLVLRWDVNVNWTQGLQMEAVGVANPEWQFRGKRVDYAFGGMGIVVPPPGSMPQAARLAWVRAIAAHEMGHALGILWHSDRQSDTMFPRINNAPAQPSDRDFRTVEALYALPNGAMVR